MKKIKEYSFNDGLDGVVNAKSLKHACKLIAKYYDGYTADYIMKSCLKSDRKFDEWSVSVYIKPKNKRDKKSKVLGWVEW